MNLPEDEIISGQDMPAPYLWDGAFPLSDRLLKPYAGHTFTLEQRRFNYRFNYFGSLISVFIHN